MTNQIDRKRRREIELAAQVRSVFERLPTSALLEFLRNLQQGAEFADAEAEAAQTPLPSASAPKSSWSTVAGVLVPAQPKMATELSVTLTQGDGRLDLVVPVPLTTFLDRPIGSIVFEFKLGLRDTTQLFNYSSALPNSLVISVSAEEDVPPLERSSSTPHYWLCQTWEHLYFALRELLSADTASRVPALPDEPANLLFKFDYKVAGQDRLSFMCEDLLTAIQEEGLLPNRDLTLVVPVGGPARETLNKEPPFYAHPLSWQSGYRFLAAISGNVLQQVYEVAERTVADASTREAPFRPDLISAAQWNEYCDEKLRVILLQAIDGDFPLGKKYVEKSRRGRLKTFTFSRRYLAKPSMLHEYFKD